MYLNFFFYLNAGIDKLNTENFESKLKKHINKLLYEWSEIQYDNHYSDCFTSPNVVILKVFEFDKFFNSCYGYSYLKELKEYSGYCGSYLCLESYFEE